MADLTDNDREAFIPLKDTSPMLDPAAWRRAANHHWTDEAALFFIPDGAADPDNPTPEEVARGWYIPRARRVRFGFDGSDTQHFVIVEDDYHSSTSRRLYYGDTDSAVDTAEGKKAFDQLAERARVRFPWPATAVDWPTWIARLERQRSRRRDIHQAVTFVIHLIAWMGSILTVGLAMASNHGVLAAAAGALLAWASFATVAAFKRLVTPPVPPQRPGRIR